MLKKRLKRLGVALALMPILAVGLGYAVTSPVAPVPATVTDDASLPRIEVGLRLFHGEVFGEANQPVVLVLHGGPGGDYRSLLGLRALTDHGYRVVLYDQLGSGLSPRVADAELSVAQAVDDLDALVDFFRGKGQVALIGHSWGGILASYYLAKYPQKVARAVAAEPGVLTSDELNDFVKVVQPKPSFAQLLFAGRAALESLHLDGPDGDARADYLFGRIMRTPGDSPLRAYFCNRTPPPAAEELWRVGSRAMQAIITQGKQKDGTLQMPSLRGLERYTDEVLLIASSCNTLIGEQRQREHLRLFPNARLAVVPNSGHLMFSEQPQASLHLVLEYFSSKPWSSRN